MKTNGKSAPRARSAALPARCRWLLALMFPCAIALASERSQPVDLRIAGQEAMAPKWIHLRNRVAGICPDILTAVERIDPRLRFVGYRQSRSLPGIEMGLESGSLDLACALAGTPRRQAVAVPAGPPLYVIRHRLVARADDPANIRSVGDLVHLGALVVAQRGGLFTDELKSAGVRIDDATDDNGVNLHKMLAGHGRFVGMNELTLRHYLRSEGLAQRVRVLPVVLKEEQSYFWVSRKADPAVVRQLGAALEKLKASGQLARIYALHDASP